MIYIINRILEVLEFRASGFTVGAFLAGMCRPRSPILMELGAWIVTNTIFGGFPQYKYSQNLLLIIKAPSLFLKTCRSGLLNLVAEGAGRSRNT